MKKSLLFTLILFSVLQFNKAQQIGNGWATVINDFTALLNSGAYSAVDPIGSNPVGSWQHLFVIRHPNPGNNQQFQLSSSLWADDRLFFRKLSYGDLSSGNPPWNELATRGGNTFLGNQNITGNLSLGDYSNNTYSNLVIKGPNEPCNINSKRDISFEFAAAGKAQIRSYRGGSWDTYLQFLTSSYENTGGEPSVRLHINGEGQVGIGTTDLNGGSALKIYRDILPTLELADNTVKFKVLVAKNGWDGAPWSQPGDVIMKSEGRQHGLILHMNDDNNDGLSYVRIGDNAHPNTINVTNKGFVGIGTFTPEFKLDVLGTIRAWGLKINNKKTADFVFAKDYKLPSLSEVETFVNKNNHLPGIASASEMEKNGVEIGEFQITLLQKIEELTLYSIQLKKENETQAKANSDMQQQLLDMKKELDLIKKQMNEKR